MNNFEQYLNKAGKRQVFLIYFIVFGLILYISVNIMMPLLDKKKNIEDNIGSIQSKMAQNSTAKFKKQLSALDQKILNLNTKKQEEKQRISFLISGLYKLKYEFFDNKELAKSMRDILQNSLKRGLIINYVKSLDVKNLKSKNILKKKRTLEVQGSGNFTDIVAFISYIDNLNTLLEFRSTDIYFKNNTVNFKLNIDLYGVGL